jgi:hypothetical protein
MAHGFFRSVMHSGFAAMQKDTRKTRERGPPPAVRARAGVMKGEDSEKVRCSHRNSHLIEARLDQS